MCICQAGQKAERERQKLQQVKDKEAMMVHVKDFSKGPTVHEAARAGNLARVKELVDHNRDLKK